MGLYLGGQCVSEDAHFASIPTFAYVNTIYRVEKIGGVWKFANYTRNASTNVMDLTYTATIPTANLVTCSEAQPYLDGVAVGWGVGLVMVIAWAWVRMMRAAN